MGTQLSYLYYILPKQDKNLYLYRLMVRLGKATSGYS